MEEKMDHLAYNNLSYNINKFLRTYRDWGFNIIPLKENSKEPAIKWKEYRDKFYPIDKITGEGNLGVICGKISGNLVVLDFDDSIVYQEFENEFSDLVESTLIVRTGKRGYHIYLRTPEPVSPRHLKGVDILGEGSYAIVPPSIHPETGRRYDIVNLIQPIKVDSEMWNNILNTLNDIAERNSSRNDAITTIIELIVPYWKEGQRDEVEFAFLGYLRKKDVPKDISRKILLGIIELTGDNEKSIRMANLERTYNLPPENLVGYFGSGDYKGLKDILKKKDLERLNRYIQKIIETMEDSKTSKQERVNKVAFVENENTLYLAVWDGQDTYKFAYYDPKEECIKFTEYVEINEVKYIPKEIEGRNGTRLPVKYPSFHIAEAPDMDAEDLFDIIKTHLSKYIDIEEDEMDMIVFYIISTWFYRKSNTVAYLRFLGDSGKGKSRMVHVAGNLCFYPLIIDGNATKSAIMRVQERYKGTLVMDEADLRGNQEDKLIKYINSGFERGAPTIISNPNNPNSIEVYDSFSPKIFGMREPFRDSATEGRVLSISPQETLNPEIPPVLPKNYDTEANLIRDILARFTLKNWDKVDGEKIEILKTLPIEPRLKQLGAPLSVILPLFDNEMDNKFVEWLLRRQREIAEERANSTEGIIFNAIVDMALGYINGDELPKYVDYIEEPEVRRDESLSRLKVITTGMVRDYTGESSINIKRILMELGFKVEKKEMKIGTKRKVPTIIRIKSTRRWIENWRRYRGFEDIIEVPDQLKIPGVEYPSVKELLDNTPNPTNPTDHVHESKEMVGNLKTTNTPCALS